MTTPSVRAGMVEVPVGDLERAVSWYSAALGLERTWSDAGHATLRAGGGVGILLVRTEDDTRLGFRAGAGVEHAVLDFGTDDLEALHAHLVAVGARVDPLGPPANSWAPRGFGFYDSEGNRLGAFCSA